MKRTKGICNFRSVLFLLMFIIISPICRGQVINENSKLLANDGAAGDQFGISVAVANGIVAVGSKWDDDLGENSGSAYLYDAITGIEIAKLVPSDGEAFDYFGHSIAINNGIIAIGAIGDGDNGNKSGSAYLFDASTGAEIAKLLPSDGASGEEFGWSIAIRDGVVAVGAIKGGDQGSRSGSVYLFDALTGVQIFKLLPSDGISSDEFGNSISISGGMVAVGAPDHDDDGSRSGSVYLFDVSTGVEISELLPNDGGSGDRFGWSVAIDNGIVAVGSIFGGLPFSGSAYLFEVSTGDQIAKLLPRNTGRDDLFGESIAINDGIVAVGASIDYFNGPSSGLAYLFDVSTGSPMSVLVPSDGAKNDDFGSSIAIDNGVVVAGVGNDDDNGTDSGSVYVFDANLPASCLDLTVENLIAGQQAVFTIRGGTVGRRAVTVWGNVAGQSIVNEVLGYCATFWINGVNRSTVLGGYHQVFDVNGEITFSQKIPVHYTGITVYFQSAERGTCPEECVSNLRQMVIQ